MPTLAEDRDAIRDLIARYCLYLHTGDAVAWAGLYADDGVFEGSGERVQGRVALEAYGHRIADGQYHRIATDHVIDVDGDSARCQASVLLTANGSVVSVGRTTDELRRVDGRWRIAHRTYAPD